MQITKVAWNFHALLLTQRIPKIVYKLQLLNKVDTFLWGCGSTRTSPSTSPASRLVLHPQNYDRKKAIFLVVNGNSNGLNYGPD